MITIKFKRECKGFPPPEEKETLFKLGEVRSDLPDDYARHMIDMDHADEVKPDAKPAAKPAK